MGTTHHRTLEAREGLAEARATMTEIFDGPLEFTDLNVVNDLTM